MTKSVFFYVHLSKADFLSLKKFAKIINKEKNYIVKLVCSDKYMLQLLFFEHINKFDFTKVISTFRNISDLTAFQQLARHIYTKLQNVLWNFKFKPSDPKYDIKKFYY